MSRGKVGGRGTKEAEGLDHRCLLGGRGYLVCERWRSRLGREGRKGCEMGSVSWM